MRPTCSCARAAVDEVRGREARHDHLLAELRLRHFLRALGDRRSMGGPVVDPDDLQRREPISVELAGEFLDRMAPYGSSAADVPGVRAGRSFACRDLPEPGAEYRYITVDRRSRPRLRRALRGRRRPGRARNDVRGKPIPYISVKLVATTAPRSHRHVGHLLIRGDNVTRGYYENPDANAAAITPDGWLNTGDLALLHEGEFYITGRSKEIIFVNGQNYYPYDLESVVRRNPVSATAR